MMVSCAIAQYTPMSVLRVPGFDTNYLMGKYHYYGFSWTNFFACV